MKVKPPPSAVQPTLFDLMPDKPLLTPGESRTRYGRVVEEIVCKLMGLQDIPNSGTHDAVFDAWKDGTFYEIKSLRHGGKLPLYEWRRLKDSKAGVPLLYAIAIHRCVNARTLGDVWRGMTSTIQEILIIPAGEISELASGEPLRQIVEVGPPGERMGYKRKGYAEGYRNIPIQKIRESRQFQRHYHHCDIYGLPVNADILT